MSDISQGGVPNVDPAALPSDFFVPTPVPEMVDVKMPHGTEIAIAALSAEGGVRFAVVALPGSKITNVELANALHSLSHEIAKEAGAKTADGDAPA